MVSNLQIYDSVSAIWILASNDENHIITYEGIRERLGLDKDYGVRELIFKHRELFRPGCSHKELTEWKSDMENGKRRPAWIKQISDPSEQIKIIQALSEKDVFRSQFRAGIAAPKSEIEIVSWGLEHIDRMRQREIAASQANAKRWEVWVVSVIGILNVIVALVGLSKK